MTDQEHRHAIDEATEALNKTVDAACRDGLEVQLRPSLDPKKMPFLYTCVIKRPI